MTDQEQVPRSAFPDPPDLYQSFTATNLEQLQSLGLKREPEKESDITTRQLVDLSLTLELGNLLPPAPPGDERGWNVFGETKMVRISSDFMFIDTPSEMISKRKLVEAASPESIRRLKPNPYNHDLPTQDLPYLDSDTPLLHPLPPSPKSIFRLIRASLLAFLELTHILARDPTPDRRFGTKWEELRDLMLNAHRAVNLYRSWAVHQQLISMLESYVIDVRAEVTRIKSFENEVDDLAQDLVAWKKVSSMKQANTTVIGPENERKMRQDSEKLSNFRNGHTDAKMLKMVDLNMLQATVETSGAGSFETKRWDTDDHADWDVMI